MQKSKLIRRRVGFFAILFFCWVLLINHSTAKAEEVISPNLSYDFETILAGHAISITSTVTSPFDLVIHQVLLIDPSTFRATVTKSDTEGELLGIYAFGVDFDDGRLLSDADVGLSPQTGISASFTLFNGGFVTVIATVLSQLQTIPGEMTVRLNY